MIAYTDTSDAGFTIAPVGITVTAPNGLEQWGAGTEQLIKWTYQGGPGPSVKIELFKGGDLHSTIASIASIGSGGSGFFWDIPADVIPGTDYRVKITSISNTFVSDTSNGDFTVLPIAVIVSSPNGGEVLHAGASLTIAWTYTGDPGPSVRIELLKGGVLSDLIIARAQTGSGGNGSFTWTIPSSLASGSDYQIRITSATDDRCTDTSNGNFTIQP
jgi:hypothetical protein